MRVAGAVLLVLLAAAPAAASSTLLLTNTAGTGVASGYRLLSFGFGAGTATSVTTTATGPVAPRPVTDVAAGTVLQWMSPPLSAFTSAASITLTMRGAFEDATAANAQYYCELVKWSWVTGSEDGASFWAGTEGAELPTTATDLALTNPPGSWSFDNGDRVVLHCYLDDAPSVNMVAGHSATFSYAQASGATTLLTFGDTFGPAPPSPSPTPSPTRTKTPTPTVTIPGLTATPGTVFTPVPAGPALVTVGGVAGTGPGVFFAASAHPMEDDADYMLPFDAVLGNLTVACAPPNDGAVSHTFRVRVNGLASAVVAVLPATTGALTTEDWTHTTATILGGGGRVSFEEVPSATGAAPLTCTLSASLTAPGGTPTHSLVLIGGGPNATAENPAGGTFCGPGPPAGVAEVCGATSERDASWIMAAPGRVTGIGVALGGPLSSARSETYTVRNVTQGCDTPVTVTLATGAVDGATSTCFGACCTFGSGDELVVRFDRTGAGQAMSRRLVVATTAPAGFQVLGDPMAYADDANSVPNVASWAIGARPPWRAPITLGFTFLHARTKTPVTHRIDWVPDCVSSECGPPLCSIATGATECTMVPPINLPQGATFDLMMNQDFETSGDTGGGAPAADIAFGPFVATVTPTPTIQRTPTPTATARTPTPLTPHPTGTPATPVVTPAVTVSPTATFPVATVGTPLRTMTPGGPTAAPPATPIATFTYGPPGHGGCGGCTPERFGEPVPTGTPCLAPAPAPVPHCCQVTMEFACTIEAFGEGCPQSESDCTSQGGTSVASAVASCRDVGEFQCIVGDLGCAGTPEGCLANNGHTFVVEATTYCIPNACVCAPLP